MRSDPETSIAVPKQFDSNRRRGPPAEHSDSLALSNRVRFEFVCRQAAMSPAPVHANYQPSVAGVCLSGQLELLVSHIALEDRVSIAKAQTRHRPRECLSCPHPNSKRMCRRRHPLQVTLCAAASDCAQPAWDYPVVRPVCRPTPFPGGLRAAMSQIGSSSSGYRVSLPPFQLTRPPNVPIQRVPSRVTSRL